MVLSTTTRCCGRVQARPCPRLLLLCSARSTGKLRGARTASCVMPLALTFLRVRQHSRRPALQSAMQRAASQHTERRNFGYFLSPSGSRWIAGEGRGGSGSGEDRGQRRGGEDRRRNCPLPAARCPPPGFEPCSVAHQHVSLNLKLLRLNDRTRHSLSLHIRTPGSGSRWQLAGNRAKSSNSSCLGQRRRAPRRTTNSRAPLQFLPHPSGQGSGLGGHHLALARTPHEGIIPLSSRYGLERSIDGKRPVMFALCTRLHDTASIITTTVPSTADCHL